jgi:hypothetical protein
MAIAFSAASGMIDNGRSMDLIGKYKLSHAAGNGCPVLKNMVNVVAVSHADIQALIAALAESALTGKYPVPDIRIFGQVGKLQIGKVMGVSVYHAI